jgi:hypothetical protein
MPRLKTISQTLFVGALFVLSCQHGQAQTSSPPKGPVPCYIKARYEKPAGAEPATRYYDRTGIFAESPTADWDCDGIADPEDNCVGMPNRAQADSDRNGIGDVCEAAATVRLGVAAKPEVRIVKEKKRSDPEKREAAKEKGKRKERDKKSRPSKNTRVAAKRPPRHR